MINRKYLVYTHIVLSSFYLPFLSVVALSGGLHLLGIKGQQVRTEIFKIYTEMPESIEEVEDVFVKIFKENGIDYKFEYIVKRNEDYIFRPTTREHYIAQWTNQSKYYSIFKVEPNWVSKLMELHKGHGSTWSRGYRAGLGFALLAISITGVLLASPVRKYRNFFFLILLVSSTFTYFLF